MNAMGPDQELRILELEGVLYEPDIVAQIAFTGNDFDDIRYERRFSWPKPHYKLEDGRLRLVKPDISWGVRIRSALYLDEVVFSVVDRYTRTSTLAPEWSDPGVDTVPLFTALARRMMEVSTEHGAHHLLVMVYEPKEHWKERSPLERRALAALDEAGVDVLDTFDLFASLEDHGDSLFAGHWNAKGHRLIADAIQAEIEKQGWLQPDWPHPASTVPGER